MKLMGRAMVRIKQLKRLAMPARLTGAEKPATDDIGVYATDGDF